MIDRIKFGIPDFRLTPQTLIGYFRDLSAEAIAAGCDLHEAV